MEKNFLTSGFLLPSQEESLIDQIDVACHFQSYASGGSILHLFIGEDLNEDQQIQLMRSLIENFPIQYFTLTPTLSFCESCSNKMIGKRRICDKCGSKDVTIWSRPVGYFRPAVRGNITKDFDGEKRFWRDARIEDFKTRKEVFKEDIDTLVNEILNG